MTWEYHDPADGVGPETPEPARASAREPGRASPGATDETVALPDRKVEVDRESVEQGLANLVLTIIELLRQLMERQAIRRMEQGDLSDEQVERMGATLMALEEKMGELRDHFGLKPEDLNLDLGPLGPLLPRD